MFSVALSVGSRPPGVTWHPVLRSPDFPPPPLAREERPSGRLPGVKIRVRVTLRKRDSNPPLNPRPTPLI